MTVNTPWTQVLGTDGKGKRFDLVNPRAEDVDFVAMATVLARTPRFNGHTEGGSYSVAQHCREGAYAILRETGDAYAAAAFLLHDGHEYIIGDQSTPVRDAVAWYAVAESGDLYADRIVRSAIASLKLALDQAIYKRAGLGWPLSPAVHALVKEYDIRMLRTEADARMAPRPEPWEGIYEAAVSIAGVRTEPWSETYARARFLDACRDLLAPNVMNLC